MDEPNPVVRGFVLHCSERCGNKWPALYDEMCWVASRRSYQGLGYSQLKKLGLSLGLANVNETYQLVDSVLRVAEEAKPARMEANPSPIPG